jgi:uncharacterized protein YbbC (DUF1343 family)
MVTLGIERLLSSDRLKGLRVGLVANPSAVDASLVHAAERLHTAPHVTLAALFGPQHGFHATVQDNMIETPHATHPRYGIPLYSLYSDTREPAPAMLEGLDALVIDLQDVGTRVYTYAYTMAHCLKAAGRSDLRVIVCDRPNPIGGDAVEGPVIEPGFESFVGLFPIALRHGLTIGELATLFTDAFGLGARLEVCELRGWRRAMCFDDTDLPWVMPSPNMPTLDTALVYPGAVLFEGTMVSEGRGTTRPFELIGAPWIDAEPFVASLEALALPGVKLRPAWFEPTFQKHAGLQCGGCQIHVTDRRTFQPVRSAVALLGACRRANPDGFAWRPPPYEYERQKMPIDILAGSSALRRQIDDDASLDAIVGNWQPGLASFMELRQEYLRYQ